MDKAVSRPELGVIAAYLILLALSLPIPILNYYLVDEAVESTRSYFRDSDGTFHPYLLSSINLLLRWLGQWSLFVTIGVAVCFALSFDKGKCAQYKGVVKVALVQCFFTTVYGFYAALLLAQNWLHRSGR